MRRTVGLGAVLLTGVLAGCVAPPPPQPLVSVPGPGKTDDAFRQDDAACRAVAVAPPAQPIGTPASTAPATVQPSANAAPPTEGTTPVVEILPPGAVYLRCMTARQNLVQPLAPAVPLYAYYQPYPVYAGVGYGYPFFYGYGYPFGFGYGFGYGRFGYEGRYFGHYRGFGGYRDYGFRGGYGRGFGHGGFGHGGFGRR